MKTSWFQALEVESLVSGSRPLGPTLGTGWSVVPVGPSLAEGGLRVRGVASMFGYRLVLSKGVKFNVLLTFEDAFTSMTELLPNSLSINC